MAICPPKNANLFSSNFHEIVNINVLICWTHDYCVERLKVWRINSAFSIFIKQIILTLWIRLRSVINSAVSSRDGVIDSAVSSRDGVIDSAVSGRDGVIDSAVSGRDSVIDSAVSGRDLGLCH